MQIPRINIDLSATHSVSQPPLSPLTTRSLSTFRNSTKSQHPLTARKRDSKFISNNSDLQKLMELKENLIQYFNNLSQISTKLAIDFYFPDLIIQSKETVNQFDVLIQNVKSLNNKSQVNTKTKLEMSNTCKRLCDSYIKQWNKYHHTVNTFINNGYQPFFNNLKTHLEHIIHKLQELKHATYDCTQVTYNKSEHFSKIIRYIKHVENMCDEYCLNNMHDCVFLVNLDVEIQNVFNIINEYVQTQTSRISLRSSETIIIKIDINISEKSAISTLDCIISFDDTCKELSTTTEEISKQTVSVITNLSERKSKSSLKPNINTRSLTSRPKTSSSFLPPQIICKTQEIKF